jgi:hypothetical protein
MLHCRMLLEQLCPHTTVQEEHNVAIHAIEEETTGRYAMQ